MIGLGCSEASDADVRHERACQPAKTEPIDEAQLRYLRNLDYRGCEELDGPATCQQPVGLLRGRLPTDGQLDFVLAASFTISDSAGSSTPRPGTSCRDFDRA